MNLSALIHDCKSYKGLKIDSRKVEPGDIFVALKGALTDGHLYIAQVLAKGAKAVVYQDPEAVGSTLREENPDCRFVAVENSHKALADLAAAFYDHPSEKIKLTGVTGTNGKTTTVTLLYRLFRALGHKCGLLSTIANYIEGERLETLNTTPDILEINRLLDLMYRQGCTHCFMEVSSHAIDQGRIEGLHFTGGVFTNLSHDHLDYHHSFAAYISCKKRFFDSLGADAFALVNIDDKNGRVMVQNTSARVHTYACKRMADYTARIIENSMDGMNLIMDGSSVWTRFIGRHNAYNLLAVYAVARLLGAGKEECLTHLSRLESVPGRLEYVRGKNDITAVIDYAHTPDALENVLVALRESARKGREIICVAGCGGDRDKSKRPEMAQIAVKYADRCIFTSDNPRSEDPDSIIADMIAGLRPEDRSKYLCITDRREAIRTAVMMAGAGDLILIAGKGHENYQIIKGIKTHLDDKEIASSILCSTN